MMPAAAIIGSAVVGAGASLVGASKAAGAQRDAANQATALQQRQLDESTRQYEQNRADLAPYRTTGYQALGQLATGLGIQNNNATDWAGYVNANPDALANWNAIKDTPAGAQFGGDIAAFGQYHYGADGSRRDLAPYQPTPGADFGSLAKPFTLADFVKDPGYEFRLSEGQRGMQAGAAARGGVLSGAAQKALARYSQDYASGEYNTAYNRYNNDQTNRFNRLASLAGIGQQATNTGIAASNQNTATQQAGTNAIAGNIIGAGNATASQYAGTAQAIGGAANNIGQYYALKDLYGGGNVYSRLTPSVSATIAQNPGVF